MVDQRDELILLLAGRIYICSWLLTAAAERLGWDTTAVQELMGQLRESTRGDVSDAGIEEIK